MIQAPDIDALQARLLASLPEDLRPHAEELYELMRSEPRLQDVSNENLADLICSDAYRSILCLYAAGKGHSRR